MHPLKAAVLHHRLDEISALSATDGVQSDLPLRSDLLRIAREMGNVFTIARVARVFSHVEGTNEARTLLRKQLLALAPNWFGGGSPEDAAHRVWVQLTEGTVEAFSKDKPDFVLTSEGKKDMTFLLARSGIRTEKELVALASASEA
jgi:hypothetical protein